MAIQPRAREPRGLTCDQKKASEAAFRGLPCDSTWSAAAHAVYDGLMTALHSKTSSHGPVTPKACYTLGYGMRLDRGPAHELANRPASITLPDGSEGSMALQVTSGTPEEIKAKVIESVEALFEIYADAKPQVL